jgi:translation initiation factor IF-3
VRYEKNEDIKTPTVRVIASNGENIGVLNTAEAIAQARAEEKDLVIISKGEQIPVAKIIDFSKFKYIQNKKKKNKGKSTVVKEWQFKPKIQEFDILNKLKHVREYLAKGAKIKVTVKSIKRSSYEEMNETMNKVLELSKDFAEKASEINKEGRNLSVFLKYKKIKDEEQN